MMFILLGVCFFYKNQSFFYHAQQLPDFISGMFFRSTPFSNKLIGALPFLRSAFLCNSMQRLGVFKQWFYRSAVLKFWSVVLCQWLKFSGCRSSKIAGVKNRVIVRGGLKIGRWFNFGCSMIAPGEKNRGRFVNAFLRCPPLHF